MHRTLVTLALLVSMAGCGSGSADDAAPATTTQAATTTTAPDEAVLTDAERVWCLDEANLRAIGDAADRLGLEPMATVLDLDDDPRYDMPDEQGPARYNADLWLEDFVTANDAAVFPKFALPSMPIVEVLGAFSNADEVNFYGEEAFPRACRAAFAAR